MGAVRGWADWAVLGCNGLDEAPMEGSSSRDGHEGGERGSSSPKKGKRSAEIALEKPLEPKRVPEIVNLEKIRIQKEGNRMATNLQPPHQQPQPFAAGPSLLPPQRHHDLVMANGTGDMSGHYRLPSVRPAGTSESASYANPSNMAPVTLTLFKETPDYLKEGESDYPKREEGHSQSGESSSKDSSDPHDLDLDLKL